MNTAWKMELMWIRTVLIRTGKVPLMDYPPKGMPMPDNKVGQPPFNAMVVLLLVRVKGLEPLRHKTPDPKSGASAIPPHSPADCHMRSDTIFIIS